MKIVFKTSIILSSGLVILTVVFILIVVFSNASSIQPRILENWWTTVDVLGTGSAISPAKDFITPEGNIELTMSKAPDPEWEPDSQADKYPYVGLGFFLNYQSVQLTYLQWKVSG